MKIILKENVARLGYKDDIVEVKDGYGRNYLIPKGLGVIANESSLKRLAEEQKQRAHKLAKIKADAEELAKSIEGIKLTITAKSSATGTIFGSVNAAHISEALRQAGHEIDRKLIDLKEPIKQLGTYTAVFRPHKEVAMEIEVEVIGEETEE